MKRIVTVFLVLLLLGSLTLPALAQSPDGFRFTRDNFPVLDGSTSMVPLGQAIASVLLGESRESVGDLIAFNRTTQSFRNLRYGQCDVVIAAEPAQQVFEEMKAESFPYLMETIAKEALIFVVNENNPVNSLTREQVRDIYAGKITNWKQVGGEDLPIEAFQRNSAAGSQVMMEKLVMGNTPMMEAPAARVPQAMGELIEAVRSFDGSANAIGYTVFYYAKDMQMAKGLKILKIDGILPSTESIRTEEYPYVNGYYCCISALAGQDSPQRRLFDWLISEEGQSLLGLEGYVRVSSPGEAAGSTVRTDYSAYAPSAAATALYTDFDCPKDHLEPSNAYGLIYPYIGARLYGGWGDPTQDYAVGNFYGFYNSSGQRITDPVFTSVYTCSLDRWTGDSYIWIFRQDDQHYGFASKDGRFVSEQCYQSIYSLGSFILCSRSSDHFDIYDKDFHLVSTQEDFRFGSNILIPSEYALELYCGTLHNTDTQEDRSALVDEAGNLLMQSENYITINEYGYVSSFDSTWNGQTVYDPNLKPILFEDSEVVSSAYQFNDYFFHVQKQDGESLIATGDGTIFDHGFDDLRTHSDGVFSLIHGSFQAVYDPIGRTLFQNLPANWIYLDSGIFSQVLPTGLTLHKLPEGTTLTLPNAVSAYRCGGILAISCSDGSDWCYRMVDNDLHLFPESYGMIANAYNALTNGSLLIVSSANGFSGETRVLSPDGQRELFRTNGEFTAQGDLYTAVSDWAFSAYDQSGRLLFCYPFYGMASGD